MENMRILSEINYIREALYLLIYVNSGGYLDTQKSFEAKAKKSKDLYNRKWALINNIEKEAKKAFKDYAGDCEYYFGKKPSEGTNPGDFAILWLASMNNRYKSTDELRKHCESLSAEEYNAFVKEELEYYSATIFDDYNESYDNITEISLVKEILALNIPDEEKIKLQSIYLDQKTHRENVLKLMDVAIGVLKSFSPELEACQKEFVEYWTGVSKEKDLFEYISNCFGLSFDELPLGLEIESSFCAPTGFSATYFFQDNEDITPLCFTIGYIFDDNLPLEAKAQPKEDYSEAAQRAIKLLSDKSKFEILNLIKKEHAYGAELAKQLNLTTATISHHMSALMDANLITLEKLDNKIFYSSNKEEIEKLLDYLKEQLLEK